MAWSVPRNWVAAELVSAAIMNSAVRDELNILKVAIANDGTILGPLKAYFETKNSVAPGVSPTFNLALGNHFQITLSATATTGTFVISNPAASGNAQGFIVVITQDGTGSRTCSAAWPASVKWPGGVAPTITLTASKSDVLSFLTFDGGTTWWAFIAGQSL